MLFFNSTYDPRRHLPDSNQSGQPTKVYTSAYGRFSLQSNKPVLLGLGLFLLVIVGFIGGIYYQTRQAGIQKSLSEKSPIPTTILENPMITSYWGMTSGTLISKDDKTKMIVLSNGLNKITIQVGPIPLTHIYDVTAAVKGKEVTFGELTLNSEIQATVTFPGKIGSSTGTPGAVVARDITILKK